jgi:virginiamycin B lyase
MPVHANGGHRMRLAGALQHTLLRTGLGAGVALLALPLIGAPAQAAPGQITEFPFTQGAINTQGAAQRMSLSADGNLYFVTSGPATVGRISPSGQVTQLANPDGDTNSYLTATGPDGNVWFASSAFGAPSRLGRITPAGQVTTFAVPLLNGMPNVLISGVATGPDGNLWFTANAGTFRTLQASLVGRVNPTTGAVTEFPISSMLVLPGALTRGSDGNLWYPEGESTTIGR